MTPPQYFLLNGTRYNMAHYKLSKGRAVPTRASLKNTAIYGAVAALGFAFALVFVVHKSDKAPEFYGAFAAAIIAGATLILGTFYQDILKQHRDNEREEKDRIAEAIDMCFWLQHCDRELEFIEDVLTRIRERLISEQKGAIELSVETFREIIKSHFFDELLERAKTASRLPPEMAGLVTDSLYKTFTIADRVFMLRQAGTEYHPTLPNIEKYIFLIGRRREALQNVAKLLETHLVQRKVLPNFRNEL